MKYFSLRSSLFVAVAMVSAAPAFAGSVTFTCDASIAADGPPGLCAAINSTLDPIYNSTFGNANANIYIEFTNNNGLADSTTGFFNEVSYATYQAALQAESTDAAKTTVPVGEPTIFGSDNVNLTSALAEALGITKNVDGGSIVGMTPGTNSATGPSGYSGCTTYAIANSGCYNGVIQVNIPADLESEISQGYDYRTLGGDSTGSSNGNYDFFSVVEHETDEILGTASCVDVGPSGATATTISDQGNCAAAVDLFRYSASGVRAFNSLTPPLQYFSPDGGITDPDGATYNTTKGGEDWADFHQGCQFVQDAEGCPTSNDTGTFDITTDGTGGGAGPEVAILNAVGFNLAGTATPEPGTMVLFGAGLAAVGFCRRRRTLRS
jgi:hypothetical protein